MKVKALELGYYNNVRVKPGTVFDLVERVSINPKTKEQKVISIEEQFSSKWMEKVKKPSAKELFESDNDGVEEKQVKKKGQFGGSSKGSKSASDSEVI